MWRSATTLLGALPPPDMHRCVTLARYHPTQARCRRLMLRQRVDPFAGDSRSASPSFLRRKLTRHATEATEASPPVSRGAAARADGGGSGGGSAPQDSGRGAEKEERQRERERETGLQRHPSFLEPSPPPPLAAEESVRALPLASYHPTQESANALVES